MVLNISLLDCSHQKSDHILAFFNRIFLSEFILISTFNAKEFDPGSRYSVPRTMNDIANTWSGCMAFVLVRTCRKPDIFLFKT